jgi:two-component system, NtrC family, sensor kinase
MGRQAVKRAKKARSKKPAALNSKAKSRLKRQVRKSEGEPQSTMAKRGSKDRTQSTAARLVTPKTDHTRAADDLKQKLKASQAELGESRAEQRALAEVLGIINSSPGNLTPVFDCILEKAHHLCDAPCGSLQLYEENRVVPVAIRGMTADFEASLRRGYPITEDNREILFAKHPVQHDLAEVLQSQPDSLSLRAAVELGRLRTLLAVPLAKDGVAFGRIVAARQEMRPFSDKQITLLQTFADQAVIAIQNVKLFDEVQAKTRDLAESLEHQTATSEVLQAIGSSMADTQPVFERILDSVDRLFETKQSAIFRVPGDGMLYVGARRGLGSDAFDQVYPLPLEQTTAPIVLGSRRQLYIADVMNEADVPPSLQRMLKLHGNFSVVIIPMLWKDQGIGVLTILREPNASFSAKEFALLKTFADQAVIAIENARLFNETREALERQTATADILKVIASSPSDTQPVFDAIAASSNRLLGGRTTTVFRFIDDTVHLVAFTRTNPAADAILQGHFPAPTAGFQQFELAKKGTPTQVFDTEESSDLRLREIARARGYRSQLYVPLIDNGLPVGIIVVTRAEPGVFANHHVELLQTFADQALIAISNVELFKQVQQRSRELSQSLDDLRTAQDRLVQTEKLASLGQLTAGIAHEIKNPLNFVNNFSALSAELVDEMTEVFENPALDEAGRRKELDEIRELLKSNLEKVVQHGKRADSIVKNMLLHSREGSGEQRPAEINALLDESLNLAYHGARAEKPGFNITLHRDLDPNAGAIDVFPQEITRAFINLISNGFYAASKRKADNGEIDFEPVLSVATKDLRNHVEIRIRDNGSGIPPEAKDKIFNPFFTTKPAGEGTGLGLSMSYDIIVKQHGGRIEVETDPGQFTEFRIVLPRAGASLVKSGERS